jgi:hypothetical protein
LVLPLRLKLILESPRLEKANEFVVINMTGHSEVLDDELGGFRNGAEQNVGNTNDGRTELAIDGDRVERRTTLLLASPRKDRKAVHFENIK